MKGFTIDYYLSLNDDERNREMYALFGHCVYNFQLLEHQLMNMILVYYKSENITLAENEYNTLFTNYSDKTMGNLIEKVISLYSLGGNTKDVLWQIHRKRNFFVHHYFKNRNTKLFNENGRIEIINEINEVDNLVIDMDKYLTDCTQPFVEKTGISEKYIHEGIEKMKEGKFTDELKFPE
jgi:hypothetical protein